MKESLERVQDLITELKDADPTGLAHVDAGMIWSDFAGELRGLHKRIRAIADEVDEMRQTAERMAATCLGGAMSWALAERLVHRGTHTKGKPDPTTGEQEGP